MSEIPKAYDPKEVEDKIYKKWEESGMFNPDNFPPKAGPPGAEDLHKRVETFSIAMPPPNATGILHVGHASMLAYQDLMVRYNRMKGKRTLWLPGTDHASIATQTKVEKIIAKEGKTKYDMGREKFLERVRDYVENSKNTIKNQTRKMGSSCDWSRERYTLDDGLTQAVKEVFVKMYHDELIYRGDRIVNWCPRCESTLADDEVEHAPQKTKLYYFKYQKDFPITIATTRPETKLGDTAVAVNPKDERYKSYIGKAYEINLGNGIHKIKIIADRDVDMSFGSGALGVTPAHSMIDWQMAQKNNLEIIKIIDENGKMNAESGKDYEGLPVIEAREKFVKYLEANNLIEKIEDADQGLSICYRCDTPIEPLPSLQWFIDVNKKITIKGNKYFKNKSLKEVMLKAVKGGEIKIIPERFEKIYFHWIENLRDWCVSRQLWFGHRIPVWYREKSEIRNLKFEINSKFQIQNSKQEENQEIYVGVEAPEGNGWIQDSDTLDTWFSSGLWTFSTLLDQDYEKYKTFKEWIANSSDLKKFHPTSVMETGYDILPFWVARMILMTSYVVGEIPFETVYLHGMVRDKQGRKMSKSLGNGIDPLEMIAKYGTDALRMSMIIGSSPGNDIKLYEEKIEGYRNFVNKLWNISRFILTTIGASELEKIKGEDIKKFSAKKLTLTDKWILVKLSDLIVSATKNLDKFNFSAAGEEIGRFMHNDLADWYLEIAKVEMRNNPESKREKDIILLHCLKILLKLLHPFIPFVTEEIWGKFKHTPNPSQEGNNLLMTEKWPKFLFKADKKDIADFNLIKNSISAIRNLRSEHKIEPAKKIKAFFVSKKMNLLNKEIEVIKWLGRLEDLIIVSKKNKTEEALTAFIDGVEIYLPADGLFDIEKEFIKIEKEIKENKKIIADAERNLANKNFTERAPKQIVAETREKLKNSKETISKLQEKKENIAYSNPRVCLKNEKKV